MAYTRDLVGVTLTFHRDVCVACRFENPFNNDKVTTRKFERWTYTCIYIGTSMRMTFVDTKMRIQK